MPPIVYADILMRGASLGLLGLLLARLVVRKPLRFVEISLAALSLSLMVYVLVSSPVALVRHAGIAGWLDLVPLLSPFLLWWAGLAIFDDDFAPKPWHALPAALTTLPVLAIDVVAGAGVVRLVVVLALYGHLIFVALSTGAGDLVEERRRFRRWFIVFAVLFAVFFELAEVSLIDHSLPAAVSPYQALGLLVLVGSFAFWSLRMRGAVWQGARDTPAPVREEVRPQEGHLLEALQAQMAAGLWRQEGLTVGALAARLEVPEHRVRRAINGGLGYRNFSAFVNERRIAEVCKALEDPSQVGKPVLALAYDVGFSSLGPFNRAFRQIKGTSPTEYRRQVLAKAEVKAGAKAGAKAGRN